MRGTSLNYHGKLTEWPVKKLDVTADTWETRAKHLEDCIHANHPTEYHRIMNACPQTTWYAEYAYLYTELNKLIGSSIAHQASV
jgi:hypothetical protein